MNIKQTLRYSRNSALLFAAATGLVYMTACSSELEYDKPDNTEINGEAINIVTDPSILSTRVINYGQGESTRAGGMDPFTMTEKVPAETEYADAKPIPGQNINDAGKYIVKEDGAEVSFGMNGGVTIYIAAKDVKLSVNYCNGDSKIYVLPEASVKFNYLQDATVYVFGKADFSNASYGGNKCSIYVDGDLNEPNTSFDLGNSHSIYVDGAVKVKSLAINNGTFAAASVTAETIKLYNNTPVLNVESYIKATAIDTDNAKAFVVSTQGKVYARCVEVPNGTIELSNNGSLNVDKFVTAKNIDLPASGSYIELGPQGVVDVTGQIYVQNDGAGFKFNNTAQEMGLIKANTLLGQNQTNNNKDGNPSEIKCGSMFYGNVYLDFTNIKGIHGSSETNLGMQDLQPGVWTAGMPDAVYPYIPADEEGCHGQYGTAPAPLPEPEDFDVIGSTDDHTHPISATCIDVVGNQAFLSWHKRGVGEGSGTNDLDNHDGVSYWGCIEVLNIKENALEITSYMETKPATEGGAYDFNHVIYDAANNALLTTGDHDKKGAIIGRIKLGEDKNFGKYTNETSVMQVRHLLEGNGISGNSVVIRPSDKTLLLTTAGGYQTMAYADNKLFDNNKLSVGEYVTTAGSAKHVAINKDYAVTIEFTQRAGNLDVKYDEDDNTTVLPAKISIWPVDEFVFAKENVTTIDVPAFGPIYGKNVIAIDDDNTIYSCQGHNGVAAYNASGAEVRRFAIPNVYKGASANGLCIKGNNLYIACGAAGVWVLDKTTFEVKAKYTKQGKASANYVKVADNGNVLVAYGRAGAKLLKPNKNF